MPVEGCGGAVTSSRGVIEPAFEPVAAQPIARMTQMRILEEIRRSELRV